MTTDESSHALESYVALFLKPCFAPIKEKIKLKFGGAQIQSKVPFVRREGEKEL